MRDRIVDIALELAEESSWESVRLHHIAAKLGVDLAQISGEFNEKEQIVDAWFDRADQAMLKQLQDFDPGSDRQHRIQTAVMAWLQTLAVHRKPTRQMILNKLEPGHLHYQVDGALRVSRTVQWVREAVEFEDSLPWRAFSEAGLTAIFLATFFYWMFDDSRESTKTRAFLEKRLRDAAPIAEFFERSQNRNQSQA